MDATPGHATNSFRPHRALGTSIDILEYGSVDKLYADPIIKQCLSAGWGPMTYRQNTELQIAAWHWNPNGTWSDPATKSGYFTGNSEPTEFLRHSYAYPLPHRGNTRNGGAERGYSRLTDGDPNSYWKSNPYLTRRFAGEDDALHPQWVVINLGAEQPVDAIRRGFFSGPVTLVTFGREQYQWYSDGKNSHADPDGPPVTATLPGGAEASFTLPKASLSVLRGKVAGITAGS